MTTEFYQEITPAGFGIAIKKKRTLFSDQSEFQKVEIIESDSVLGKFLTLDDLMMCTEGDEYHYHEMIAHIPMMNHPNPKSVLVIGGGDGGTVREVSCTLRNRRNGYWCLKKISSDNGLWTW